MGREFFAPDCIIYPVNEALDDALDEALEEAMEELEPAIGESASAPSSESR